MVRVNTYLLVMFISTYYAYVVLMEQLVMEKIVI